MVLNFFRQKEADLSKNKEKSEPFGSDFVSNPHTKDVAILKLREGRYCERNPGGVSFTYNNPAARISLRSKLDTNKKRRVETRRFLLVDDTRLEFKI